METETLGEKIYRQRKIKGLSQEELADKIGVSRQAISKWETNSMQPTLDSIKALCSALDVNIAYLTDDVVSKEEIDEMAISLEKQDSQVNETKSNRRIGYVIGIALISLLFVVSLIVTVVVGMAFFPTTTGDIAISSSNIEEKDFAAALIVTIILFVADIALVLILHHKKKANVK